MPIPAPNCDCGLAFLARLGTPCRCRRATPKTPDVPRPIYCVGLDVGNAGEVTALAVVERIQVAMTDRRINHYAVRHLRRFPVGTPYADVAAALAALFANPPVAGGTLAVDLTAVGRPVLDLLKAALPDVPITAIGITAGAHTVADDRGGWLVPRRELTSLLQVLLQSRWLKVAAGISEADTLVRELTAFKVRTPLVASDDLAAWREGDHDDLVLALAIAVWQGERSSGAVAEWVC